MKTKFITIPKGEELNEVMRIYKDKWQFPMCTGAIDGTHIPIIAPVVDHAFLAVSTTREFFPIHVYTRREMKMPFLAVM